ncbi:hypothetical protein RN001_010833 [Aquatica leii]|uniref:Lipocalin/cytosolic fatty-acid binding domain-containing protein n=1 Tax=Aquatica leii TaxID=1421715 RepID=A0AAN7SEP8_9COLE|nr:hypothetical protein RN001_010833 [Aquatica leii]
MYRLAVALFFAYALCQSEAKCPNIEPMSDFYMEGILGHWYVIQRTGANSDCLTDEIQAVNARKGHYELTQTSPSGGLVNAFGLRHEHNFKFRMQIPNLSNPAVMDFTFPVMNSYKLTVLDTDYDNYLVFVLCNKRFSLLGNVPVVVILSRTPTIEPQYLETVYSKLLAYSINPFTIKMVNQHQCARGEQGVLINTATNILDTLKHTVDGITGGITGVLQPKQPVKPVPKPKDENEYDPSVTGEYNIDVRSSFT